MLPQFDIAGQQRVGSARALLVGVGGLGSPVALYLTAAGVGRLVLVDHDRVDMTNLQRQVLFDTDDIGKLKVEAARARLQRLNPLVRIDAIAGRLEGERLVHEVERADVVIDATDNFATRFLLNAACVRAGKPLVSAAAIRMEAQIAVYDRRDANSPCYRCLYRDEAEAALTCSETGVLGPLVGVIGSMQALEALKILAGVGGGLAGRLLVFDAQHVEWRSIRLRKDPACPVCGATGSS
jgi:adenylyltransferase/sulfurtransferase